jgi:hypothetical protein
VGWLMFRRGLEMNNERKALVLLRESIGAGR